MRFGRLKHIGFHFFFLRFVGMMSQNSLKIRECVGFLTSFIVL